MMDYHGILLEVRGKKASVRIDSMGLQLTAFLRQEQPGIAGREKTSIFLYRQSGALLFTSRYLV